MSNSKLEKAKKEIDEIVAGKSDMKYSESLFAVRYKCHKAIEEYICDEYSNYRVLKKANCNENKKSRAGESKTVNPAKIIVAVRNDEQARILQSDIEKMIAYANTAIEKIACECHKEKYAIKYKINCIEAKGSMEVAVSDACARQVVSGEWVKEHISEYYDQLIANTADEKKKEQYRKQKEVEQGKIDDQQMYSKQLSKGLSYRLNYYDPVEKRRKQANCNQILVVKNLSSIGDKRLSKGRLDKYSDKEIIEVSGEKYCLTHCNYATRKKNSTCGSK